MPLFHHFRITRLVVSYALDWIVLIVFAGLGGAFSIIEPVRRNFSVTDPSIAFPYRKDTVSVLTLFLVAVVAPAAIVLAVCTVFARYPSRDAPISKSLAWRRKLWELHAGWLGLALSVVLSFFLTQTLKNMFGKPRPDLLARCNPDFTHYPAFTVGGFTNETLEGTSVLVNWNICLSKDGSGVGKSELQDGFRSFPSGHSTTSFAGLFYLTLFLASKFAVTIPVLVRHPQNSVEARATSAAPPLYLLVFVFSPLIAAAYIASTRYTDYKHHGFDILFGSIEGALCAWFGFRLYHLPVRQGAGWAWGPRSARRAFGIGIGTGNYVDYEAKLREHANPAPVHSATDSARAILPANTLELHDIRPTTASEGADVV